MTTKPGDVYRVDLGMAAKVRLMVVVSREDDDAPRALALCAPVTTAFRESAYEVALPKLPFLRTQSFVNLQGTQPIRHHELTQRVGKIDADSSEKIRGALRFTFGL